MQLKDVLQEFLFDCEVRNYSIKKGLSASYVNAILKNIRVLRK